MKKMYLVISILILLSSSAVSFCENPKIFSDGDVNFKIFGIKLGMEKKAVEKILGKPKKMDKHYEGAVGDVYEYYYDFGKIRLEQYDAENFDVASIFTDKANALGPRNIRVGEEIETVLAKFPYDKNAPLKDWGKENKIKYIYGKPGGNSGVIEYDKTEKPVSIRYYYQYYILIMNVANGRVKSLALVANNS